MSASNGQNYAAYLLQKLTGITFDELFIDHCRAPV